MKIAKRKVERIVTWLKANDEFFDNKEKYINYLHENLDLKIDASKMIVDCVYAGVTAENIYIKLMTEL